MYQVGVRHFLLSVVSFAVGIIGHQLNGDPDVVIITLAAAGMSVVISASLVKHGRFVKLAMYTAFIAQGYMPAAILMVVVLS